MRKLQVLFTFFVLFLSPNLSFAECFKQHLKDAIELNEGREKAYRELTNGKSFWISKQLIYSEKVSLLYADYLGLKVQKYRESGVPLLCRDFISMQEVPEFSTELRIPRISYNKIAKIKVSSLKRKYKKLVREKEYSKLVASIQEKLSQLALNSEYNCMTRHLLESLGRSSNLVAVYIKESLARGLGSPEKILQNYLKRNISTLSLAYSLDKQAAKIQEKGIPIICQDVPHIPIGI